MLHLLEPARLTEVVDIGANPIEGDPVYKGMMQSGLCRVTGFEPQETALAQLRAAAGPNERYLPNCVGDGKAHTLHICHYSGMTSLLQPGGAAGKLFDRIRDNSAVKAKETVETQRLDAIAEIEAIDLLKIDVQGAELSIFQNGRKKLAGAVAVHTEVSFLPIYRNQPSFEVVGLLLRTLGFIPYRMFAPNQFVMATGTPDLHSQKPSLQLIDADVVYVRDYSQPDAMSDEQLKHLALIMHHCYGSFDIAVRCVVELERRGAIKAGAARAYAGVEGV